MGSGNRRVPRPLQVNKRRAARGGGGFGIAQQLAKILVGGLGIANMKLHGLPGAYVIAQGDCAAVWIGADDVAHEEVTAAEFVLVLAHRLSHVQAAADEGFFVVAERFINLLQSGHRGLAGEFEDHVAVGLGNDKGPADGAAAL